MLHRTLTVATIAIAALSTAACGSSAPSEGAHIRGTVSGLSTQNGRAVAVTSQGKSYWAALDKTGTFDLALPAGANASDDADDKGEKDKEDEGSRKGCGG